MSPLVPTSSRDTMPCRSLAPLVAMRYPAAARPPTTVGPVHPTLGWAATPTGLSTTTMSLSSWMIVIPGTGSAITFSVGLSSTPGRMTSRRSPAATRSDFPAGWWLRWTSPALARSAALVRETPKSRARAASTRSPSSPSGTNRVRASAIRFCLVSGGLVSGGLVSGGLVPAVLGAPAVNSDAPHRQDGDHHGSAHDGDVREVADEPAEVVDEVHDVATAGAGFAEDAVAEVAEGTAEQEAESPRPGCAADAPGGDHDEHQDATGDEREHPGRAVADGERRTRVADEVERDQRPEHGHGLPRGQGLQGPPLGELVSDQHRGSGGREEGEQACAGCWGRGGLGGLFVRCDQRRSCFVLHGMHRVARGAA